MKPHLILKDFTGSQTGIDNARFREGEVEKLSDSLAHIAVREGWAEPVAEGGVIETQPSLVGEGGNPAELRNTKVVEPQERKPFRPTRKK